MDLKQLSKEDQAKLYDAIPLITVLIAGADGDIEKSETDWAKRITKIRSFSMEEELDSYYKRVGEDFEERLDYFIESLPGDVTRRNKAIAEKLSELNDILPKIEYNQRLALYRSWLTFAKHVAMSSGGIVGALSISPEEAKLINLPMIDEIV